ncbi:unnamed protein product [Caenorhabditis nigoni]
MIGWIHEKGSTPSRKSNIATGTTTKTRCRIVIIVDIVVQKMGGALSQQYFLLPKIVLFVNCPLATNSLLRRRFSCHGLFSLSTILRH